MPVWAGRWAADMVGEVLGVLETGLPERSGPIRNKRARFQISPLVALLGAVLLLLILPPTIFLIDVSLHTTNPDGSLGNLTLDHYRNLFAGRFFLSSLTNTAIYAVGS